MFSEQDTDFSNSEYNSVQLFGALHLKVLPDVICMLQVSEVQSFFALIC